MPIIRFTKVSYQYPKGDRLALRDIDLQIQRGEFIGIIGATGAGKTTLCLTMNGIVPHFYGGRFFGHAFIGGRDSVEAPVRELARVVGEVFEDPETQIIATSVENEVAFSLENFGFPRAEIRARVEWALVVVGLAELKKKHPQGLSGGQKQRLAIAAAIAVRPDIIVLDEPTSQLDSRGAQEVMEALAVLNRQEGVTVVMASHAVEQIAAYADRVFLLHEGRLAAQGTPREVFSQSEELDRAGMRLPETMQVFQQLTKVGKFKSELPVTAAEGQMMLKGWRLQSLNTDPPNLPREGEVFHPAIIRVQGVRFNYPDGTKALDNIHLSIEQGEYVLLTGQNGAGKTTLAKMLLNLARPQAGRIIFSGEDISSMPVSTLARKIGYVGQNPDTQLFTASVHDEVAFALRFHGLSESDIEERVMFGLEAVGLGSVADRHPFSLPKGDRARVVIAAVLALRPEVIVFDEPTIGQDYRGARRILDLTQKLHKDGKTVIVITHHLYLMREYAERMVVVSNGKVVLDGPIRNILGDVESLNPLGIEPPEAVLLRNCVAQENRTKSWQITADELAMGLTPPGWEET